MTKTKARAKALAQKAPPMQHKPGPNPSTPSRFVIKSIPVDRPAESMNIRLGLDHQSFLLTLNNGSEITVLPTPEGISTLLRILYRQKCAHQGAQAPSGSAQWEALGPLFAQAPITQIPGQGKARPKKQDLELEALDNWLNGE